MHAGSLDRNTEARKVYEVLVRSDGRWLGGRELQDLAYTTAVSTRVSEVRHALNREAWRCERLEHEQRGRYHFYRVVATGKQMELAI